MDGRRANRDEWQKRIERWSDSGLSAKQFAAETGINAGTLQYWKYKPAEEAERRSPRGGTAKSVTRGMEFYRAMSEVPSLADIPVGILTCDPGRAPIGLRKMGKTSVERLIAMVNGLFSRTKGPSRRAS
jgi:hypothetical protein